MIAGAKVAFRLSSGDAVEAEVGQVVDVLRHFRILRIQRQRLGELGAGHVGLAHEPCFVGILDQFGDAVLAGDLQVGGVLAVRGVRFDRLGESFFRRVDVALFHGAHALSISLLRCLSLAC